MLRTKPPFRADEVGSLLRPPRIKEARAKLEKGEITADDLDEETVKAYVKDRLARHKVPRDVTFIDELPRNETGKVVKRELTEQ